MIVKKIEEDCLTTYRIYFNKNRKIRVSFSKNENRIFFNNISEKDVISDNFECHNLKKWDYKRFFDWLKKQFPNQKIVFDLYCLEDVCNIKKT